MTNNVIQLRPVIDIPAQLREIAKDIESGDLFTHSMTIITDTELHHLEDCTDDRAIKNAVWNMNQGVYKILRVYHGDK